MAPPRFSSIGRSDSCTSWWAIATWPTDECRASPAAERWSRMLGEDRMSEAAANFEGLLREALAPVEPPEDLVERLESTLTSITELAVDELEAWELSAMRDPRNWARPAAAVVVGSAAAGALVILRANH